MIFRGRLNQCCSKSVKCVDMLQMYTSLSSFVGEGKVSEKMRSFAVKTISQDSLTAPSADRVLGVHCDARCWVPIHSQD